MKTPMQELIDIIKQRINDDDSIPYMYNERILELAESLLEKEKEVIMNAYDIGWSDGNKDQDLNDLYYFETFNTKEK